MAAERQPSLVQGVSDSIEPVKILLSDIIGRLKLKERSFGLYPLASESDIEEASESLLKDTPITPTFY